MKCPSRSAPVSTKSSRIPAASAASAMLQSVDLAREREILVGEPPGAVRREDERHLVPADVDVGVMVRLLCKERHRADEALVLEGFADFTPRQGPAAQTAEPLPDVVVIQ